MFGEDEFDEVSRAPSPWDPFLPSPASSFESTKHIPRGIPKLAPEIEEGNVEYKLKLTDISPARFARLVTQLKWRLLEGSGQAYYELGVADSGALIGLSRGDLERSLETLEEMAGEIGASVIVVKEIEVPSAMVAFADRVSAYIDPDTGEWTEKMSNKRFRHTARGGIMSGTETDTTEDTDAGDAVETPGSSSDTAAIPYIHRLTTNPERPTAQSSPFIAPIDDDLALFCMEPEPEFADDDADDEGTPDLVPESGITVDIEIAAVYKPRPFRRRTPPALPPHTGLSKSGKRAQKRPQPWHKQSPPSEAPSLEDGGVVPNKQEAKALHRRMARDRKREEKRKALVSRAAEAVVDGAILQDDVVVPTKDLDTTKLSHDAAAVVTGLEGFHVSLESAGVVVDSSPPASPVEESHGNGAGSLEPRLIVEALVVRKLSIEEAFLDFGGFSLT